MNDPTRTGFGKGADLSFFEPQDLRFFERRMRSIGKHVLEVTADDIKVYKRALIDARYRPSAVAHKLTVLRSAYQQWADKGFISWETVRAVQAVEAPPVEKNNTPALTQTGITTGVGPGIFVSRG